MNTNQSNENHFNIKENDRIMARPEIINHMHTGIDGKINAPHLNTEESHRSQREYYELFLGEQRLLLLIFWLQKPYSNFLKFTDSPSTQYLRKY